jgi:hypothetical protein
LGIFIGGDYVYQPLNFLGINIRWVESFFPTLEFQIILIFIVLQIYRALSNFLFFNSTVLLEVWCTHTSLFVKNEQSLQNSVEACKIISFSL